MGSASHVADIGTKFILREMRVLLSHELHAQSSRTRMSDPVTREYVCTVCTYVE